MGRPPANRTFEVRNDHLRDRRHPWLGPAVLAVSEVTEFRTRLPETLAAQIGTTSGHPEGALARDSDLPIVRVVDDDPDMRAFIAKRLGQASGFSRRFREQYGMVPSVYLEGVNGAPPETSGE